MASLLLPITGSVGSRIRLIFANGNEWLLLLDHDDGDREWQTKEWRDIPRDVAKQLNNCTDKGRDAKVVDFGPTGAWYINGEKADGTGGHSWWGDTMIGDAISKANGQGTRRVSFGSDRFGGETHALITGDNGYNLSGSLHDNLHDRLERINSRRKKIRYIRLFHNGQFFISDDEGTEWLLENMKHCSEELRKSDKVEEVAIAGDGSWVVIQEDKFVSSTGVDADLGRKLAKFFSDQRRWINERRREIQEAREAQEREAREAAEAERLAREDAAREERERARREAREAAQRAERERIQREVREAERAERENVEREAATRISSLEAKLNQRFLDEAKEIKETEANLQRRKCSLLDSMPREIRARSGLDDDGAGTNNDANTCVVCHDEAAVMAVVPCGHVCLCNACSDACLNGQAGSRVCPLCRGNMQSVLRIYLGR